MACTKSLVLLPRLRASCLGARAITTQAVGGLRRNDLTERTHTGQVRKLNFKIFLLVITQKLYSSGLRKRRLQKRKV